MIRIALVGVESMHAARFAELIASLEGKQRARIVGIWDTNSQNAEKFVAQYAPDAKIADSLGDLAECVDAAIIIDRFGSRHFEQARPFLECGMPVFVDKPLTASPGDAAALVQLARERNTCVLSGSGCKFAGDTLALKQIAKKMICADELHSGHLHYAADLKSPYDGFYFYASHAVEMVLEIFGYDIKSVIAVEKAGNVTAIAGYNRFSVVLTFAPDQAVPVCFLIGGGKTISWSMNISDIFANQLSCFLDMAESKKMPLSYEQLTLPVFVIDAILRSLATGKEVTLS